MRTWFNKLNDKFPALVGVLKTVFYSAGAVGVSYLVTGWFGAGMSAEVAKMLAITAGSTVGIVGVTNQILILANGIQNKKKSKEAIEKANNIREDIALGKEKVKIGTKDVVVPDLYVKNDEKTVYLNEIEALVTSDDSDKQLRIQHLDNNKTLSDGAVTSHEVELILNSLPTGTPASIKNALNSSKKVIEDLSNRVLETETIANKSVTTVTDVENKCRSI